MDASRPTVNKPPTPSIPPSALLRPLGLIGILFGAFGMIADPDLWGHIRFGLDIIDNGAVHWGPDPYSFTADRPFLYHEWLGGVVMAVAFRVGGSIGLIALKAMLAAAPGVIIWFALRRTQFAWRWFAVNVAAWMGIALTFALRPQLWTGVAVVVVALILTGNSRRRLWLLPPIFAIWANLHGGWIVGGGMVAVWTGVAWLERSPLRSTLLATGAASLACTLLTPYGFGLWTFLLETVRLSREDIVEWRPIWQAGFGLFTWSLTIGVILFSWKRHGRPSLATLVTLAGLAFASAQVLRLVPLFTLIAVTLLSRDWPRTEQPPLTGIASRTSDTPRALFDAACVIVSMAIAVWAEAIPRCLSTDYPNAPDTVAAEALRGTRGRLVTHFNYGEYALWHFGPDLKVSIDGRRETLYSMETLWDQLSIATARPRGLAALERIRPEYVWLPARASATAEWLKTHGYREDVRTEKSFIAVRADLPRLMPFTGVTSGCFPGP